MRLAPTHATVASEAVLSFTYVARPTIRSLTPGTGPAGRGGCDLQGANLNRTSHCACRFGTTVVECASRTDRAVKCVSPPIVLGEGVHTCGRNCRWTIEGGGLVRSSSRTTLLLLHALSPIRGPSSGGTIVTISGNNFRAHRVLSCRFDERVVSASFVSTEAISCRAPPGHDVVKVSISQSSADYGALQSVITPRLSRNR